MKLQHKGIALAVSLLLALTACSGSGGDRRGEKLNRDELASKADYNPQPRENVKDGGSLTEALSTIPDNLNALHADANTDTVELRKLYNPQLQFRSEDGKVSWNKDYITNVSDRVVGGNRVVTYTINDKAEFDDGTPIDWRAFKALWKATNGKNKEYAPAETEGFSLITAVKPGKNDKQAVVTYDGPWLWWESQFKWVMHPDATKDANTFNTAYTKDAHGEWGAGPFRVKKLEPGGTTAVFERNPKWWGKPSKLDTIVVRAMASSAQINAFRNGELDAVRANGAEDLAQVNGMKNTEIRKAADLSVAFMHVNASSPKLRDPNVRKAIQLGVDRDTLQKVRYEGMNWQADLPGMVTLYPFQRGYRDLYNKLGGGYDPRQAKKLLDKAGWTIGGDGIRRKDGKRLELLFPAIGDASYTKNVSAATQAMMKAIGVDLKLDYRNAQDYADTYTKQDYDLFQMSWSTADPDENFFYFCYFYCSDAGYTDQQTVDTYAPKVKQIGKLTDKQQATDAFIAAEKEILSTWQIQPLYNAPKIWVVKKGLANFGAGLFSFGPQADIGWQKTA
ncbi:ABC transporter family substrate-binding protein [Streptomyces sp. NBC_01237]|uniref:ABC transporter family substrate-binding protein n=1 Tax=Streptomyces sp. NBC_01237 TaxID=2903790 RepID=UPI002DD9B3DC|nr:ABC transporter family substrate-binding protein [Streptomyces sp. NBC_01237]WRZ77670.1 ABC transporter family substrate-binding protein [Streptomyces sp. NBC_01237]